MTIQFQPIYSFRQSRIIGLEALARPDALNVEHAFAMAQGTDSLLQLDRLCRQLAIASYAGLPTPQPRHGNHCCSSTSSRR